MIKPVSYKEILDDPNGDELLREYSEECSMPELGYAYPQREMYDLLEKSGGFQAFGLYSEGSLLGFGSVLMHTIPHYGHKIATNESIFVTKSFRNTGWGLMLRNAMKQYAKNKECLVFLWTVPKGSTFDRVMDASSARHSNNVYVESL